VQRVEAHPIEFAVWVVRFEAGTSPDEFAVSDAFMVVSVTDKLAACFRLNVK